MASQVDIANLALSILGKPSIASLADGANAARVITIEYDLIRQGLLEGPGIWRFTVKRASLPSLTSLPISGPFRAIFAMPSDCLRPLQVGDMYPGLDLSDYRQGPTDADYSIEGRNILCDYGAPLSLQYVADITDTTQFNPNFVRYFAAKIAWTCCERLTGSDAKQAAAEKRMTLARSDALLSGALVNPPNYPGDDSWILARMQ
jgi:hypothetical protein